MNRFCLLSLITLLTASCASSSPKVEQKQPVTVSSKLQKFQLQEVASGFDVIWGFDFLSSDKVLITERNGTISLLDLKANTVTAVAGAPTVKHRGQGGLLDIALSPNFAKDRHVYYAYSAIKDSKYTTRLSRAKWNGSALGKEEALFSALPYFSTTHHYGGRIAFDGEGHVFLSVGDRGRRDRAQSLDTHNGKIIRLKMNGDVPADNPFTKNKKALSEIWSYGHRNPQGLVFDSATRRLWVQEHGPRGGDEINWAQAGKNYGWPIITYGREYSGFEIGDGITEKAGMEQPVKYYVPSIAPSGLIVYSGQRFAKWKGHLFSGALALRHLNRIQVPAKIDTKKAPPSTSSPAEEKLLEDLAERVRNVKEGPNGMIWVSTDSGKLLRLK